MTIPETDLHLPALQLMASRPNGFISTADLIIELDDLLQPEGDDTLVLDGRSDTRFSQKVRNLVSHRNYSNGLESQGLATYSEDGAGWQITDAGRQVAG